jgi:hypothetical protein
MRAVPRVPRAPTVSGLSPQMLPLNSQTPAPLSASNSLLLIDASLVGAGEHHFCALTTISQYSLLIVLLGLYRPLVKIIDHASSGC